MSDLIPIREPENGNDWRCQRCDHQWRSRRVGDPKPTACAKCRSAYWDKPPKRKKEKTTGAARRLGSRKKRQVKKRKKKILSTGVLMEEPFVYQDVLPSMSKRVLESTFDEAASVLPPPPHLRRAYRSPESAPMPENLIGRKDANGTKTTKDTE